MNKVFRWTKEEKLLIKWFMKRYEAGTLPQGEFKLNAWSTVLDGDRYFESLKQDIERGPDGPRATQGALRADLQCLFFLVEKDFKDKLRQHRQQQQPTS